MKSAFRFFVFLMLVIGWGLSAMSLHVIRTPDDMGFTLVTKERFGLTDTYVDTRHWTLDDVSRHPLLVKKLIDVGKEEVLRHVVSDNRKGDVSVQLIGAMNRTPKPEDNATATQPAAASSMLHGIMGMF